MTFNIDKFKVIPQGELSKAEFDYFLVWSEHYDSEELEEIERWGLDTNKVIELFKKNEDCLYTCLECDPIPDRMRIFIKATLKTHNGLELEGYIMNDNAFCLGIFLKGEKYSFSRHPMLSDLFNNELLRLSTALGVKSNNVFPITYETDFFNEAGIKILGKFDMSS